MITTDKKKVVRSRSLKIVREGTGVLVDELSGNLDSGAVSTPMAVSVSASSASAAKESIELAILSYL